MKTVIYVFILLLSMKSYSQGQLIIGSSGECQKNNSASLSWTLGEVVTTLGESRVSFLTQGFQQPNLVAAIVSGNIAEVKHAVGIYPNPFQSSFFIESDSPRILKIEIFNIIGSKVLTQTLSEQRNQINMDMFSNGVYILRISSADNALLKVLKINKEN